MKVKQVMLCNPYTVRSEQTLADASRIYLNYDVNCAPVLGPDGEIVGIITITKVLESFLQGCSPTASICEFMDDPPAVVKENADFEEIAYTPGMERMLVLDQNNKLTGILSRVELIKKVYQVLEETRNELSVVLQSVSHSIIAFDAAGIVYLFNKGAEILLGISREEALNQPVGRILPDGSWQDVLTDRQPRLGFKLDIKSKSVVGNATPIYVKEHMTGAVVVLQDLSEMENLIYELSHVKELKNELDNIIESSYDGILVVNTDKQVLRVNKSALQLLDLSKCKDNCMLANVNSEIAIYLDRMVDEIRESRQSLTKAYIKASGKEIMLTGNPRFGNQAEVIQIIFNMRDITELNRLQTQVRQANEERARCSVELLELRNMLLTEDFIAKSPVMEPVLKMMSRVSQVESNVLITGESGVGKEVAAKRIHKLSYKGKGPFITVNCGAIPENLLESELFGYEKGAFTGANKEGKVGLMEAANNGTIFFDEIGELPLNLQVKLLRAIQEKVIYRVGRVKPIQLDTRIIAATNRNLKEMVNNQTFREDLFYRLNVIQIEIPPLRERKEDILFLIDYFLKKFSTKYNKQKNISPEAYRILENYYWPGNVRELENVIERAVILSEASLIELQHLPENIYLQSNEVLGVEIKVHRILAFDEAVQLMEKELLRKALEKEKSIRKTASLLGITHTTVLRKGKQYGLI